ncbi:hypothetical protein [Paraflavitalea pollutisoli]|uniref:hypothetical protein n=1 Tax=Paraflavitalea pollutisoli TaxID=3034143 RepID=UPI0023ECB148|nr:hypothetical protein [Paraflavitalea sp. H1-2-19X]
MYRLLLSNFFLLATITGHTQSAHDSLRIVISPIDSAKVVVPAFDRNNMSYVIPDNIYSLQADVLYLPSGDYTRYDKKKHGYEIVWPSDYIDGSLKLIVTKRQIYLVSGHNNPNPNRLYWFTNITAVQYKRIASKLFFNQQLFQEEDITFEWYRVLYYKQYRREKELPNEWTDELMNIHEQNFRNLQYQNTSDLIALFNRDLSPAHVIQFPSQADFEKNKPIRIIPAVRGYEQPYKQLIETEPNE